MPQLKDPGKFEIDHEILDPVDHFKLLIVHLDAYKNDYVNREIKAMAMASKFNTGLPKAKEDEVRNVYDRYYREREAFKVHIEIIRSIMYDVYEKMSKKDREQFVDFTDDIKERKGKSDE